MGSDSKKHKRQINFTSALKILGEQMDQKFLLNTQHFTQALSSLRVRLEALEDIIMLKLGVTEAELNEQSLLRIERMQNFQPITEEGAMVKRGSVVRVKVKEELVGSESPTAPMQDAFMHVGTGQVNPALDDLIVGSLVGETRDVTLPDPKDSNIQRKLTITVVKLFKGDEINEQVANTAVGA